jgi:Na+-transporting NADH:ubiquinone oxidoreductase subunit C
MHDPQDNVERSKSGWFASMPNDSTAKTLIIAILLCLVCSVAVSTVAVKLKPLQMYNAELSRRTEILSVAGLMQDGGNVDQLFEQIETRIVALDSGEFTDEIDSATFDPRLALNDPVMSEAIPAEKDVAGLQRRSRYAAVYIVRESDGIATIILPVSGKGLYSTLFGFLALEGDGNTISGLTFYEDGETPGLGGEINNPRWQSRWVGLQVRDDSGKYRLEVVKGATSQGSEAASFQVDAISGATLTSRGVDHMMQFWLGDSGFGPFLEKIGNTGGAS